MSCSPGGIWPIVGSPSTRASYYLANEGQHGVLANAAQEPKWGVGKRLNDT